MANTQAHADFDRAIDKIRDEMAKSKSRYVEVVGEYLTGYLRGYPAAAGAILAQGKTIQGSLAAMRKEAEKVKDGGVAVLDDETGFRIVLKYFGIEKDTSSVTGKAGDTFPSRGRLEDGGELSLDALMGVQGGARHGF